MNNRIRSFLPDDEANGSAVRLQHVSKVTGSMLQDALDVWGEIWQEFDGSLTSGTMIVPTAAKDFSPQCGWPELLEKFWRMRLYLASAKKFCDQEPAPPIDGASGE